MTKKLLIIAFAGLSSTMAYAADLYVRNGGVGGAYSTVSAAIAAASDGDRIIIQPKTNGTAYVENLIINKSLTFVSETNYNKYIIEGKVTVNPAAGRMVTISSMSLGTSSNNILEASGATSGGRTTINLVNCDLNNVFTYQVNTTTNVTGSTVKGNLIFSHGICTANKTGFISIYSMAPDTVPAVSDIEVYGNVSNAGIQNTQINYNFKFYNNFCTSFNIGNIKAGSSNEIVNNTVYSPTPGDLGPFNISINGATSGNIAIMNNAVSFVVGQTNVCIQNSSTNVNVTASYNLSTNPFITQGNMTQSNNSGAVNMNFDNTAYTVTGMNVNAGNPDVKYTDLDLTRNDVGHYGGSNSWANFWPADNGGKPQVNYLVTPRTVSSGTLTISGSGFSK
ncbi:MULTISPECIES: hypothetical protein [unclassified Chryseobacterium]|uniref:hypothetical protein n=1 Tax=unclassified Chryseobacterium TaxID=2593645 RepID=UPI00100BE065|nr:MULTISPECIES: hypothetical protein [unclassified Chryseobacterium]RXM63230.1 hypothetical protein BOQ60_17995 [Chryseobacterium sp. CH1]